MPDQARVATWLMVRQAYEAYSDRVISICFENNRLVSSSKQAVAESRRLVAGMDRSRGNRGFETDSGAPGWPEAVARPRASASLATAVSPLCFPPGDGDMVDDPDDLRRKADRFERLMSMVTDLRALQALRELARSYRQRAEQIIGRRRQQEGSSSIDDTPQSQ